VNNAGTVGGKLLLDLTDEDIKRCVRRSTRTELRTDSNSLHRTFDVNVLAQFTLIKALLPNMIEKKAGHIVRPSSPSLSL
jgi:NAD(P)-dependent dehydrogenase (short-subunit alcohol dehydrogenase family)